MIRCAAIRSCSVALAAAAGVLAFARHAGSSSVHEHFVLTLARPSPSSDCPNDDDLRRAVVARLGYDPFAPSETTSGTIAVTFSRRANRWGATVSRHGSADPVHRDATAVRELQATGCSDLLVPVAIAVAIAVDPFAGPTGSTAAQDASPPLLPSPSTAPEVIDGGVAAATTGVVDASDAGGTATRAFGSRPELRIGGGVHAGAGVAPAIAPGIWVEVGVRRQNGSIALEGRADRPVNSNAAASGGRVSAQLLAGSLVPCFHLMWTAICGVLSVGVVRGEGLDVARPSAGSSPYLGFGARLAAEMPLNSSLRLTMHGDIVAAPLRTTLQLNGVDYWTSPTLNGLLGLGLQGTIK